MNFANKYRLIPFVSLTKDDAKLGQAYDELVDMLRNDKIPSPLKVALLERTIAEIQRFKEDLHQPVHVATQTDPVIDMKKEEVEEAIGVKEEPILETTQFHTPAKEEPDDDQGPWTPVQRKTSKKRNEVTPKVTPPSAKKTRSGKEYDSVRKPTFWGNLYN